MRNHQQRIGAWLDREGLSTSIFALVLIILLVRLPEQLRQDSWLALFGGRAVADGLPGQDYSLVWAQGKSWVDQQWLSQWLVYQLHSLGGLRLALLAHVALIGAALLMGLIGARRLGGNPRASYLLGGLAIITMAGTWQLRTQSFVMPLYVLLIILLVQDSRKPTTKVLVALPLLGLWANLHGSVLLAAGIVALYGIFRLVRGPERAIAALLLTAPAFVFASPYGLALFGYYRHMLSGSAIAEVTLEWRPSYTSVLGLPFYLLLAATLLVVIARRRHVRLFEASLLAVTAVGGVLALRNMPWFAFAALVLVPGLASSWLPFRKRRTRALRAVPILLVATACAALVVSLTRPASWYERSYPTQAAQIVADAVSANPSLAVFPDAAYGSWLLWKQPSLAGRVVYDSRFELLTDEQLREISVWENAGKDWEAVAPAEAVLVLNEMNPNSQKRIVAFKKSGRLLYRDQAVSVWILPRQL